MDEVVRALDWFGRNHLYIGSRVVLIYINSRVVILLKFYDNAR